MEPNSLEVTLKSLTAFALKSNQNWWLSDYNSQCFPHTHTRTQTMHLFSSCSSATNNWEIRISKCVAFAQGKREEDEDKASRAILFQAE